MSSGVKTSTSVLSSLSASVGSAVGAANGGSSRTSGKGGLSGGAIAGIVIGILALAAIGGIVAWFCLRRRRRSREEAFTRGPEMSQAGFNSGRGGGRHVQMPSGGTSLEGEGIAGAAALGVMHGDEERADDSGPRSSNEASPVVFAQQTASTARTGQNPFATAPNTPGTHHDGDTDFNPGDPRQASASTAVTADIVPQLVPRSRSDGSYSRGQSDQNSTGLTRSTSKKRKPVPSLGPELRDEMERKMSGTEELRKSYQIVPDPPASFDR